MSQALRDPQTGQYLPGTSGGPGRKPLRITEAKARTFLGDMEDAWLEHGQALVQRVIKEDPGIALRVFASLVPKELLVRNLGRERLIDPEAARADVKRLLTERG